MRFKVGDKVKFVPEGPYKNYAGIVKKTFISRWSKEEYITLEKNQIFYAKDFVKLINHPNTNIFK